MDVFYEASILHIIASQNRGAGISTPTVEL